MMRLHFTEADLRMVTLAPTPNPMWEAVLSVRQLRGTSASRRPGIQHLRRELNGGLADRAGILLDLVPAGGFIPDFLLQPAAVDIATGVELMTRTPEPEFAAELSRLPSSTAPRLRNLATRAVDARRMLGDDLRGYFDSTLAPLWRQIQVEAAADRGLRAETLLRGGIDALLSTLSVHCSWQPPTLHVRMPGAYDVPLCGRGLLLIPSYFAVTPMLMYRPDQSTVLVYPMYAGDRPTAATDALGPLLGRTRAAVLAALRTSATTTAVAERVGISLASASQHTAVLRNAGLLSTSRMGGAVLHTLTPLGSALLSGDSTTV
ncbi:ArsR/SmtB family transcription factor [Streptosporangium amethystogenes]|uniref:ArsR/SmtB family transcription factor n=1 Tax=Streptosporangium amethystogenes TaxID=2002 RepID=UPI00379D4EE9